jgi:RimJ/RimL family protein N-acetyltransferase
MAKRRISPLSFVRVRLRLLCRDDLRTTLAWRNKERIRREFFTSRELTAEEHAAWFDQYESRDDDFVFVVEAADGSRPIGQVSLYRLDEAAGEAEFGRLLIGDDAALGQGFGKEATAAMLSFGLASLGLRRIYLEVRPGNTRAIRLYERLGFARVSESADRIRMEIHAPTHPAVPPSLKRVREICDTYRAAEDLRPRWLRDLDLDPTSVYYRFLFECSRTLRPAVVFEIGTCEGKSAAHLAAGNPDGLVITLDVRPTARTHVENLRLPNLVFLQSDSMDAPRNLRHMPKIDLLFIDGDHRFDQVYAEYALYRPHVKDDGLIFFDDIDISGEMRRLWAAIPDPKESLPALHYTGFGVAARSAAIAPLPLRDLPR